MSTTIELEFETHIDLDFIERGIAVHLIRLTASVQLQTTEGWTKKYRHLLTLAILSPLSQTQFGETAK